MEPTTCEHLSALMDGELGTEPARFLLRRVEHEPELARAWSHWHLIRAVLNGERVATHADPVRLARAGSDDEEAFSARVLQAVQARPQVRRHWARYLGGGAIAASVAAAALILSVPQTSSPDGALAVSPERSTTATAAARTGVIAAAPVSAKRESAPLPWIGNQAPVFLAERPAAASSVLGGGLLRSDYLQQAAYAPGAAPLQRNPGTAGTTGNSPPYLILLMPDRGTQGQQQRH